MGSEFPNLKGNFNNDIESTIKVANYCFVHFGMKEVLGLERLPVLLDSYFTSNTLVRVILQLLNKKHIVTLTQVYYLFDLNLNLKWA